MIDVILYKFAGQVNELNKTLTDGQTVKCSVRADFDITRPIIKLRHAKVFDCNYIYIPAYNRYYFVSDFVQTSVNEYTITLSVDVLQTYKNEIMEAVATCIKSDSANGYISTRDNILDSRPNYKTVDFPNKNLFDDAGTIIMITIKGTTV